MLVGTSLVDSRKSLKISGFRVFLYFTALFAIISEEVFNAAILWLEKRGHEKYED